MEKILIKTKEDVKKAINFFGKQWSLEIERETRIKPCFLIGSYSDDVEFGSGYKFDNIKFNDFADKKNGEVFSAINWVACSERLPDGAMGSYLACLENNTVHKLQYSDITKHWWDLAMGDIRKHNPVKYWAELPEPPCL